MPETEVKTTEVTTPPAPEGEAKKHHIPLPNGKIFEASDEDLMYLAVRGAAAEFEQTVEPKTEPKTEPKVDSSELTLEAINKKIDELAQAQANSDAARRIERRSAEIANEIDGLIAKNPIIRSDEELQQNVREIVLANIAANSKLSVKAAIEKTISTFEKFTKSYKNLKTSDAEKTRGTPSGKTGTEEPKVFKPADLKNGGLRNHLSNKLRELREAGSFN